MAFIKKHVKSILLVTAVLICSTWYVVKRERDYFTHLNRITKKFIGEMEEEHGFSCFSIGGSLAGNIKKVSVKFFCYEKKSIEEARQLELKCVERLCEMINSHKKIRPHLEEFPFTKERVGIMLCFCKEDLTSFPEKESIGLVMSCREKLIYDIEFNDHRPNETVLEESLSEAYEKVRGQQQRGKDFQSSCSTCNATSSESDRPASQGIDRSAPCDAQEDALYKEIKELERKYGFYKKTR